jgi:recombination protein RecR
MQNAKRVNPGGKPSVLLSPASPALFCILRILHFEFSMTAPPLANLINELSKLPGIGGKSAARLAYHILKRPDADAEALASAIIEVKQKIFRCSLCNNMTDVDPCVICSDPRRDASVICVVEEAFNIATIEAVRDFRGAFHVLLGALSPLKGVGPDEIDVHGLVERIRRGGIREVIVATNPNVEGEATALYIAQQIRPMNVRVTRLGFGLPVGGDLEYADQVTMAKALEGRREI